MTCHMFKKINLKGKSSLKDQLLEHHIKLKKENWTKSDVIRLHITGAHIVNLYITVFTQT